MADELSSELASLRIDRDEPPASRGWLKLVAGLLILGGLGAAAYFVGVPYLEAQVFKTEVSITEISRVSPAQGSVELTATGYVVADRRSRIAPKVPGRVLKVYVEQGSNVQAGDKLLELDPADNEAAIAAAQSSVAAARAQAQSAVARAETARSELKEATTRAARERALAKEGISPAGVAEDLEARVDSLKQAVAAADAAAKAAQAEASALGSQVNVLKVGLNNLELVAPISGKVVNKPPQLGEFVGPQPAGVSVDMGGVEIADFSTLVVEVDVPEQRLFMVKSEGPAEIVLDAFPDRRFRGRTKEITPQVDRAKATVIVKVGFVDQIDGVLPDMSARVSFLSGELDAEAVKAPPKTVISGSAITERNGAKVVFVVEGESVRMRAIEVGPALGSGFEVIEGPGPGTRVVSEPPPTLSDGMRIKEKTGDD